MDQNKDEFDAAQKRLKTLDDALAHKRAEAQRPRRADGGALGGALGQAFRLATTLVVTAAVGAALGYGLGALFGYQLAFLIGGLAFGFAAGVRETFRAAQEMQADAARAAADEQEVGDRSGR